MNDWIRVCDIADIPRLGARVVPRRGEDNIAVFRTADDSVFAVTDRCPHRGGPLSQGIVFGHRVACPLHNLHIELDTGCAVAPDTGCVERHPVKVSGGVVYLGANAHAGVHN
jgi:nitrite reductase (NADH) small subunit